MTSAKGRFRKKLDPQALRFSSSLRFDRRLYREDIPGSIAHVRMLGVTGIIPPAESRNIERALRTIEKEIRTGKFSLDGGKGDARFAADDVHMAIEKRLI